MAILTRLIYNIRGPSPRALLRYCSTTASARRIAAVMASTKILPTVKKSPLDARTYRAIELPNKMRALLISDPTTDMSAAALSVAAGSMHDPLEIPGLAHFLEHMLFLGTKKYPEENEYHKFLSENGGTSNAYTARDQTCYYFELAPKALEPALDRFAQFFISPSFSESGTEREVNAVNSEHEKNIPNDDWRFHQLEVYHSDPKHPYCKFATGNRATLWELPRSNNIDVRSALLEFHKTSYSANIMNLAIIGKESLDELQTMVESKFTEVLNTDVPLPRWDENPYGPNQLKKWVKLVPVKDLRQLSVMFPIPDTTAFYKTGSEPYISHLIGHEGPGSLLSLLKEKHWVNQLSAGGQPLTRGVAAYKIVVELTPEGMKNMEEIVFHIFQYLALLKSTGPLEWMWKESSDLGHVFFRFKDKEGPQSLVADVVAHMHDYPVEDIFSRQYLTSEYNPDLIKDILSYMTPERCLIISTSKEYESISNQEVPYYGAKYLTEQIPDEVLQKWTSCTLHEKLKMPEPNEFIPKAFDLKTRDENTGIIPRIIKDTPLIRTWFLQDNEFELPKGVLTAEIYCPGVHDTPKKSNLNFLFTRAIKDSLTEKSYAAALAGLHYDVVGTEYGVQVAVSGYDHKLDVILKMVVDKMINFSLAEERFSVLKEVHVRKLKNWKNEQPYHKAFFHTGHVLREGSWTSEDLLASAEDLTLKELQDFASQFLKGLKFEFLIHGNFTQQEAQELASSCEKSFVASGTTALLPSQIVRKREVNIPPGTNHVFTVEHQTHQESCAAVLYQTGLQNTRENVLLELVESVTHEPAFNQLRTQEQLGYIVLCNVRRVSGTQGITFLVQSSRSPAYVEGRIEEFLRTFHAQINNMTDEEFAQHRDGLLAKIEEKPKTLSARAKRIWNEIKAQQFVFDRQNIEAEELKKVGKQEFLEYFATHLAPDAPNRKRLSVQVISVEGAGKSEPDIPDPMKAVTVTKIEDVEKWRLQQGFYPAPSDSGEGFSKAKL